MSNFAIRLPTLAAPATLVLAVFFAHAGSLDAPFLFDDEPAILLNDSIRDLSRPLDVLFRPPAGSGSAGRPMVNFSLALNYAFGGQNPRGYHVFNVLVHACATLALFGALRRGWELASPHGGASSSRLMPWLLAALWAIHPLQTESVACVIQRTELLVGLFYLLTIYFFLRAVRGPHGPRWETASIAACAAGMASKEVMVSAPLLVALYDRTFVAGSFAALWAQRRSYYLKLASTWVALAALLAYGGGSRGVAAGFGLGVSSWEYLLKQCEAITLYLRLTIWPHPLVLDYGTDVITAPLSVAPEALLLVGLFAAGVWGVVRRSPAGFVAAWFFAILAPSSSVVPLVTQTVAEHRMYLPLAATLLVLVVLAHRVFGRLLTIPAFLAVLGLGAVTLARNRTLQDPLSAWADTVAKAPQNPRAHASYAAVLAERGRPFEAIRAFQASLALDPDSAATHQNIGNVYFALRHFDEAETHFRRTITLQPTFASAHNNLGALLLETGQPDEAVTSFDRALALDPNHRGARQNRARAFFRLGRFAEAANDYRRLLHFAASDSDVHYNLGLSLARAGDLDTASEHFSAALRLRPDPVAHLNYARFLLTNGRTNDAIAALQAALRIRPDFTEAREELERLQRESKTPR